MCFQYLSVFKLCISMVGLKNKKSLSDQIMGLSNPVFEDHDPENMMADSAFARYKDDADYESDEFEGVGRSSLRANAMANQEEMDEKYEGVRTSRKDLDSEEGEEGEQGSGSDEEEIVIGEESESEMETDGNSSGDDSELAQMLGAQDVEDETSARLQQELNTFGESAGKMYLTSASKKGNNESLKGKHVTNQLKNWDTMFESRIKLQKLLGAANRFPQADVYGDFLAHNDGLMYKFNDIAGDIENVLQVFFDLQYNALKANEDTRELAMDKTVKKARKRLREDDASVDEYWSYIETLNRKIDPYNRAVIQKWNEKTQLAAGGTAMQNKKFKALNQSVVNQIDQIMLDEGRLLKRTHLKRGEYRVIGKISEKKGEEDRQIDDTIAPKTAQRKDLEEYDEEIFDDTDFYHQLLRELIDKRTKASSGGTFLYLLLIEKLFKALY